MSQEVVVSFLTSGPQFTISVPDDLMASPFAQSPLQLPGGGRECVFTPIAAGRPTFGSHGHDEPYEVAGSSKSVWVTRRFDPPVHWFVEWRLHGGTIQTHVRDEDGYEMVELLASNVQVDDEGPSAIPTMLATPPLGNAASRRPGYQEAIYFDDAHDEPQMRLELRRPGAAGRKLRSVDGAIVVGSRAAVDIIGHGVDGQVIETVRAEVERQLLGSPDR